MQVDKMKFERRSSLKYYHMTCIGNKTYKLLRGLLAGFSSKRTNSARASRPFLYISLPSLRQYIVKLPNLTLL